MFFNEKFVNSFTEDEVIRGIERLLVQDLGEKVLNFIALRTDEYGAYGYLMMLPEIKHFMISAFKKSRENSRKLF